MHRETQLSGLASPFYHAPDAHAAERMATLIDEHIGALDALGRLLPLQPPEAGQFIAFQVM